ncbi:Ste3-like pheromone receptor, partial [Mycena sanguinolenta]
RNVVIISIIIWLFVSNVILSVNAIIWQYSIAIMASFQYAITTKLQIGPTMALWHACCLHLFIHLVHITSVREGCATVEQKHPRMLFDFAMCCGPPIISMALH